MELNQQFAKSFKHKLSEASNEQQSSKAKSSCHKESVGHNFKPVCCRSLKTDNHCNSALKVRRLKTRKERNQIRGQERSRSHPHHQQNRKNVGERVKRHHIPPMSGSRKESTFSKPFVPQKPSIITEFRLTSVKGLFSHEVRSVNIERLVSEQMKQDKQKNNKRTHIMMHITSPLPPLVPDSDCIIDDIQEPENNLPPQMKRNSSRKNTSGFQTNTEVAVPVGSSMDDGEHTRNHRTGMEDNNSKTKQNSPREPEHVILSSSENEPVHQFCSTPCEPCKPNYDTPQPCTLKSPDDGNLIQKSLTEVGFMNIAVAEMPEYMQMSTSVSEHDSGAGQLADSVKQGEKMSESCREMVKRLVRRVCQAPDLYMPRQRCPLLVKGKKTLMQTLQKRHGLQLEHNLHRLRSSLNGKLTESQLSSDKDRCNSGNIDIWKDKATQQDYLSDKAKQHLDRGFFIKKDRKQEWKNSSPQFLLKEPHQPQADTFDHLRAAQSFRDPIEQLFNQDQTFTEHDIPILRAPTWDDQPVNPFSQQQLESSWTNVHLDLSKISQQLKEDTDLDVDLYHGIKQKPLEESFGASSFWSNHMRDQDEEEKTASFSFSSSYFTEGFQYKPFFRCPRPSNTQHRSECPSMTLCPMSNTPSILPFSFSEGCLPRSSHHWFS